MTPEQLNAYIIEYNKMWAEGQISKEEYIQLIQGINIMEGINDDAEGLAVKEQLNTMINAAISVASMAV
jgi:phage tail tape-measure protein